MDIKSVIDGLESCGGSDYCAWHKCPYYNTWPAAECFMKMCLDAAGLLREYAHMTEEENSERTEEEHSPESNDGPGYCPDQ